MGKWEEKEDNGHKDQRFELMFHCSFSFLITVFQKYTKTALYNFVSIGKKENSLFARAHIKLLHACGLEKKNQLLVLFCFCWHFF
jgi:hypothetical protein